MKIVFVGGGTLGHFNPLMAVADSIRDQYINMHMVEPDMYYLGERNMNEKMLEERAIKYVYIPSGKNRVYFSFLNFLDYFKLFFGIIYAFIRMLFLYPDIVFSKGGYDSVSTCVAAFLLRIPIVLHDSDAIPGRASLLISKFASRVALSYPEATKYFKDQSIVAVVGQPILSKYFPKADYVKVYNQDKKNILITGGTQGSQKINDTVLQVLPELCAKYNVVHQTGENNIEDIKNRSKVILENYNKDAYSPYATLDFSMIYKFIDIAVTRAGSTMFELAAFGIPTIVVPIPESISRDQVLNAEAMNKKGFIKLIYEENLSPHVLLNIIEDILDNKSTYENMSQKAIFSFKVNAANEIAKEILNIIATHKV